jgi:hypothetical protein
VIWSSGAGVQALVAGIPVIYQAPHWICEGAADDALEVVERNPLGVTPISREAALQRMAWAQWSLAEIASGEPFRRLLA